MESDSEVSLMIDQRLLKFLRDDEIAGVHPAMTASQVIELLGQPEVVGKHIDAIHSYGYGNLQILFEHGSIKSFQLHPEGGNVVRISNSHGLLEEFRVPLDIEVVLNELGKAEIQYRVDKNLSSSSQRMYRVGTNATILVDVNKSKIEYFSAYFYDVYIRGSFTRFGEL